MLHAPVPTQFGYLIEKSILIEIMAYVIFIKIQIAKNKTRLLFLI
jgi:hypothetical protein